jgi:hypothetical protein
MFYEWLNWKIYESDMNVSEYTEELAFGSLLISITLESPKGNKREYGRKIYIPWNKKEIMTMMDIWSNSLRITVMKNYINKYRPEYDKFDLSTIEDCRKFDWREYD